MGVGGYLAEAPSQRMVEVPVVASLVTTDSEVVLLVAVGKGIQVSFLSPLQRGGALRSSG